MIVVVVFTAQNQNWEQKGYNTIESKYDTVFTNTTSKPLKLESCSQNILYNYGKISLLDGMHMY